MIPASENEAYPSQSSRVSHSRLSGSDSGGIVDNVQQVLLSDAHTFPPGEGFDKSMGYSTKRCREIYHVDSL
jgi:hypothetical protein